MSAMNRLGRMKPYLILLAMTLVLAAVVAGKFGLFDHFEVDPDGLAGFGRVLELGSGMALSTLALIALVTRMDLPLSRDRYRGRVIEEEVQQELKVLQGQDYREPNLPTLEQTREQYREKMRRLRQIDSIDRIGF